MDDRYSICDICGHEIIPEKWDMKKGRMVSTGQKEVDTPDIICPTPSTWGDGVCHAACIEPYLAKLKGINI